MVSQLNSSGMFPRIHHIRVTVEIGWNTREFYGTNYLHVDVQRHLVGIERQQERMRGKCLIRLSLCKEIESRTMVIYWTWFREKVVFYSRIQTTRRMGQNCRANDDNICRKHTPSLPIHESIFQRSAYQQRRPGNDYNCFFAQLFLLISSVFTEQSQICVKNVKLATIEQGDLLWKDNVTHCSCQVWWRHSYLWPRILHNKKKIYCKDIRNELKRYHNKTNWANFVRMQDSWLLLKSDSISWRKTLKNTHNSQMQWPVVSTLCQETKIHLNRRVGSEGTPKLGLCWKLQPVACKVNTELRSELCLWTKTILTRGS